MRWPLEIVAGGLALAPLLAVMLEGGSRRSPIPARPEIMCHPVPVGSAIPGQAWILPLFALAVYGFLSQASGTWAWSLQGMTDLPSDAWISLLLKPVFGAMLIYVNQMLIREARQHGERPSGWLLCGLITLRSATPVALCFAQF